MVFVPDDLWVAELVRSDVNHGIAGVGRKSVSTVSRIGNLLHLISRGVEGVNRDDTIILVREKAGRVVRVDDGGSRENTRSRIGWEEGDRLVRPPV